MQSIAGKSRIELIPQENIRFEGFGEEQPSGKYQIMTSPSGDLEP